MDAARSTVLRTAAAGTVATVVMDAAMLTAAVASPAAFSSNLLGFDVIGRWANGLCRGRLRTTGDVGAPARRRDTVLGLATHYATGIALTEAYRLALQRAGRSSSLRGATAYGVATAALPLFILYPSLGYGVLGSRSGEAPRLLRVMLLGHLAFGLGIGIALGRLEVPTGPSRAFRADAHSG